MAMLLSLLFVVFRWMRSILCSTVVIRIAKRLGVSLVVSWVKYSVLPRLGVYKNLWNSLGTHINIIFITLGEIDLYWRKSLTAVFVYARAWIIYIYKKRRGVLAWFIRAVVYQIGAIGVIFMRFNNYKFGYLVGYIKSLWTPRWFFYKYVIGLLTSWLRLWIGVVCAKCRSLWSAHYSKLGYREHKMLVSVALSRAHKLTVLAGNYVRGELSVRLGGFVSSKTRLYVTFRTKLTDLEVEYTKHRGELDAELRQLGGRTQNDGESGQSILTWVSTTIGLFVQRTRAYFYLLKVTAGDNILTSTKYKRTYWRYDYAAMINHYLKKYVYTINHKRIGLSYLYFCLFSGLSGAMLAAFIRLELAYPGSHFFKGDSVRYIQVISAHGLIMIFYVVVPIVFGLFANYFIPFHIQSKDVAFPRLNSIGFWLLPAGFILMSKPAFTRRQVYRNWDPYTAYNSTREGILKNFIEVLGEDISKVIEDPSKLTYGKLHDIFNNQPDRKVFKTLDKLILRGYWDGNINLSNTNFKDYFYKTSISDLVYFIPGDGGYTNSGGARGLIGNFKKTSVSDPVEFFNFYQKEISVGFYHNYTLPTIKYRHFLPPVRTVEDIRWTLRDQIAGRVPSGGDNRMEVIENWTDFLMLWEYTYSWAENPWKTLRHALGSKSIVMKNEKCSSPTAVMSGWTFITPFSSQTRFTGLGAQDAAIVSVLFAGLSSTLSFTNLLITRRVLAAPGFKNRKNAIPFLSISLFLVMRMLALITPVLGAAMVMLLMDRHWSTSFFDYAYGGDGILFHHLFWFFGHPEVYVVIIPAFGIVNSFLPYYNKRRIASKNHLVWATYVMAYMGFLVWGHHMYLVGLDHRSRSLYSTITVMISLPAVVKIVNWTLTFLNGVINVDISLYFIVSFLTFFLSGGLTGLWLSHVGLNLFVHDTFYVVAHFHFMFSCATFSALFAGFYFYYKEFFGVDYSRPIATVHYVLWTVGQWLTFTPLYWVGYNGLPRRYHDYPVMYMGWHGLSSSGHMITMLSIFFFLVGIIESKFRKNALMPKSFGIPRTFKRVQYVQLKSIQLQESEKIPYRVRLDPAEWSF